MMKLHRYINYFLGFSVIAGLLGRSVSKKRNTLSASDNDQQPLSPFLGTWLSQETDQKQMLLKITQEGEFFINDHPLVGNITSVSKQQLVFTDHFGYELIAKRHADNTLSFYDDADEREYLFILTE